jgi:peptide/nickel transport system substrate-binding protein
MSEEKGREREGNPPGALGMTRRGFLKISGAGLAGAVLLGVAGCGGGGGGQEGGGGGNGGGGGGGASGDTLIVGYDQEPEILNRLIQGGDALSTSSTTAGIMEYPVQIMPDLTYAPLLAADMPELVSEDPQVVEYTLKEGLTWSDGEPLTSEDAKWTYDQIMNEDNQILSRVGWEDIESFETPDERTVRITFSQPFAPWMDLLSNNYPILPKHVYEGENFNEALNNEIIGSGPYKLKEWRKGQSLTVEANENYWGDPPQIKEVTYRFIPDSNTLIASLESQEVSFIYPPPDIGLLERLESIEGAKALVKAGVVWEHIAFNLEKVPDLKLRQAIAYGINREQIVNELLKGQVNALQSWTVPEQTEYYTPAWEKYSYDPDQARQLFEEAQAEGAPSEIVFSTTSDNRLRETLQELVQQQLDEIGLGVQIKNTSATTFFGQWTVEGNFEMAEWAWLATPDPGQTILFSNDQIPTDDNPSGQNYYRYDNQEVTDLLKQSDEELDVQARADLLKQAQEIMSDDLPLIPLYQRPEYYAFAENLEGPEVNPSLAGPFWNMGKWRIT